MVNYPNGIKKNNSNLFAGSKHDTRHRGYSLEQDLNESNEYYLNFDKAVIHKKPTPIQIVKVDYPSRNAAKIVEAYFKIPSTTDYNGIYRGKYIDFEAKEINKLSFPFQNIHPHQIEHLSRIIDHGGIAFVVMGFSKLREVYLLEAKYMIEKYYLSKRKSLSYDEIKENGYLIPSGYRPRLDYLKVVDEVFFKEDN